jgi:anti-sigma regulatory factor (Ser/Thr protein kinase)
MHDGSITVLCSNQFSEIERLQHVLSQFCDLHGIPRRHQHSFNLALDEVVTNIIRHGYADQDQHVIVVKVELSGNELKARVEDDGCAFSPVDYPAVNPNKPISARQLGGLGIHLVRNLISRMDYQREGEKNVLTLSKLVQ